MDQKLLNYIELLFKWQKRINLISSKACDDVYSRHIEDSLQLQKFIPHETKTIIDLGSGAGLPGIPLAIATEIKTYLVESDLRKSIFLDEVIRHLGLDALTKNKRIEDTQIENLQYPIIITARALADMNKIFGLISSFLTKNNIENHGGTMYKILLLKGKNVSRETFEAEKHWKFGIQYEKSLTDPEASIAIIDNLEKI